MERGLPSALKEQHLFGSEKIKLGQLSDVYT